MSFWEIVLIGAALSMDAFAVSLAGGMACPRMGAGRGLATAGAFAFFQFLMPLLGYGCGAAFSALVARIAPWLSLSLLALLGGKMIADSVRETAKRRRAACMRPMLCPAVVQRPLAWLGGLLAQGVATSLDALAVGVTLLAVQTKEGLPFHIAGCAAVIGAVTLLLSFAGVQIGKRAGDALSAPAGALGGGVLIAIGIRLFVSGVA